MIFSRIACLIALSLSVSTVAHASSLAERLGYRPDEKLLIVHVDDLGLNPATNEATFDVLKAGIAKSASVLAPAVKAREAAEYAKSHGYDDLGVHLTLTSEPHAPWRPMAGVWNTLSLVNFRGYLTSNLFQLYSIGQTTHVEREIEAQVQAVKSWGIQPTHLDSHMGSTLFHPKWFAAYLNLARRHRIPPMIPRGSSQLTSMLGMAGGAATKAYQLLTRKAVAAGFLPIDDLSILLPLPADAGLSARKEQYLQLIRNLKPGVNQIIIHTAYAGDEGQTETVQSFPKEIFRDHEARIFQDPEVRSIIETEGVRLISWKEIAAVYPWDQITEVR